MKERFPKILQVNFGFVLFFSGNSGFLFPIVLMTFILAML